MKTVRFFSILLAVFILGCDKLPNGQGASKVGEGYISDYFFEEMEETISSVSKIVTDDCLTLCVLADNHISSEHVNIKANEESLANIRFFNSQIKTDGVVHLGDLVAQTLATQDKLSNDEIYSIMSNYLDDLSQTHDDVYVINGNHDGESANIFKEKRWLEMVKERVSTNAVWHESSPYFYVDYPEKQVRTVFIALPEESFYGYSENLFSWMKNSALNVEDGTDIIIFGHIPVFHANYLKNQSLHNRDTFVSICKAFNNHSAFCDELVDVDYSLYHSSKIVAYVSGHAHTDLVAAPGWSYNGTCISTGGNVQNITYKNDMPCPVIIEGRNLFNSDTEKSISRVGGITYERKHKHASQDLWDVLVYDKTKNSLSLIRFGAGNDRIIRLE